MAQRPGSRSESQRERRQRQRAEEQARRTEEGFQTARNAQTGYARQLRQLARQVARIVENFAPQDPTEPYSTAALARIREALAAYAKAIAPWARAATTRMITEVNRRDRSAWERYTRGMGLALRKELAGAPIGEATRALLDEQVDLITSLPIEAAQRVHEKTLEGITLGTRYPERVAEIEAALAEAHPRATEQWLLNRATLIARTETARTASVLMEIRAKHVGSESYVWKTAGDWKVRPSHKLLNGTVQRWDDPPLSDPPDHHSHPGQIWNCRCVALPVLPG